jgi:photosystem II stability/assembly factor-like uncharacterized protein
MRYATALGLLPLFGGSVVCAPASAGRRARWWTIPLVGGTAEEAGFAILGVATGPVGAVAADPHDPQTIYLGGNAGLFQSSDGGETWALLSQELRYPHILLVDPCDPARLYAARRDLASFLPLPSVYRSDNGGVTWKTLSSGLGQERIFALAIDARRPGTLYAGSWAGRVYKSVDAGQRWALSSAEPVRAGPQCAAGTVGQLLVNPLDGTLYALEAYAGAFRSSDGGATWTQVNVDSGWLAVDARRGDLYLAGRRLQRSTDGGQSWQDIGRGLPYDPQRGAYAAYWIGVNPEPLALYTRYHRSTDGGVTWEPLESPSSFVPRLLLAGNGPVIYGSVNGQAGRYQEARLGIP